MTISSRTNRSDNLQEDSTNVAPLLSEDGRDFLDGRINAEKYVTSARYTAALQARRDVYTRTRRHSGLVRIFAFALGTLAYAALGIVTLTSEKNASTAIIAFATSGISLITALLAYHRGRYMNSDDQG